MRQIDEVRDADCNAHSQRGSNGLAVLAAVGLLDNQGSESDANKGSDDLAEDNVCRLLD